MKKRYNYEGVFGSLKIDLKKKIIINDLNINKMVKYIHRYLGNEDINEEILKIISQILKVMFGDIEKKRDKGETVFTLENSTQIVVLINGNDEKNVIEFR